MPLSCSCPDDYPDPGMTLWTDPREYSVLSTSKRQRCCSCNILINIGETISIVHRHKIPETDIECKIYGEDGEIPRANKFMCEKCTDIFFSLQELGFCVGAWENQFDLLKQYKQYYK